MLRFLRIGFLLRKELDFEILPVGGEGGIPSDLTDLVYSGLYNYVTSLSFSLVADVSNGVAMLNSWDYE
jgi:hypothetical protein